MCYHQGMKENGETFIFKDDLHIESSLSDESGETLLKLLSKTDSEILSIKSRILELNNELAEKVKERASIAEKLHPLEEPKMEIRLNEPSIHPGASTEERVNFLFNLFHGRRDVYATRYLKKDEDRIAYSPVCSNRFQSGCIFKLPKEERKDRGCLDCSARSFTHLVPEIYYISNIQNRDERGIGAVGIYPMLPDSMCRFLAIDLDEETWQHDALEIADIARRDGFQMAVERSFSGNGAHLWLFFSEEIPASKARELAFSFIDKACEKSKTVSLKSYDRIFPTQDRITDGGLGNLILMPIVRSAAMREIDPGTVFVDNSFVKYDNQIKFLSSVPQYTKRDVELYLLSPKSSTSSSFVLAPFSDEETDVIWRNRLPSVSEKDCLVDELPVFLSAGVSIPKCTLSAALQNALKRLACFTNPEYFIARNRNRGFVPEGVSLFIETFIESEDVLELPRGLKGALEKYLTLSGIPFRITDSRASNTGLDAEFNGSLKPEQKEAFNALMGHDCGILQAATSFGKTVIAAALIAARREKTLILVQSRNLLMQWKESLSSFLTVKNPPLKKERKRLNVTGIGVYGSTTDTLSSYVDIAMIQTVSSRMPQFIRDYGMVIVDECHHLAADTFIKVMHMVRPKYIYGLSATVERKDRLERTVYAQLGAVIYKYAADKLAYQRGIRQIFVPRFTDATARTAFSAKFRNDECQKDIAFNDRRNDLIALDISKLHSEGRRIVVLTQLIAHITEIRKRLEEKNIPSIVINGSMNDEDKKKSLEHIKDPENKAVIISTGRFLGEGTDIPYLDTLIVAAPVSWKGLISQYVGRISREYEGKDEILIYDYVDILIPPFALMYNKRLKAYRALGYIIKSGENPGSVTAKSFFSEDDIYPVLYTLIRKAEKSIIISSPHLELNYGTEKIINNLGEAAGGGGGIKVEVRTSDNPHDNALSFIRNRGITISKSPDCYLKYAVFDTSTFLFGELDILGSFINVTESASKMQNGKPKVMILINNSEDARTLTDSPLLI